MTTKTAVEFVPELKALNRAISRVKVNTSNLGKSLSSGLETASKHFKDEMDKLKIVLIPPPINYLCLVSYLFFD